MRETIGAVPEWIGPLEAAGFLPGRHLPPTSIMGVPKTSNTQEARVSIFEAKFAYPGSNKIDVGDDPGKVRKLFLESTCSLPGCHDVPDEYLLV